MSLSLSPGQLNAMQVTERVASIFSLLGIFFILSTFLLGRGFDKPINRLIFFASWSNLGMNIATLIAEAGVDAGINSSLCQFQAFAIQMFLGVDVLWALCMAFNVYLALFRGWTAKRMRAQEWKYFAGCYGCSFIPAFAYIFVNTQQRGQVYGPALLWCWIGPKWDFLRIVTLYAIVWVAILAAFMIYCLAFRKVWRNRHELRGIFNPFNEDPFAGIVTTEIAITRHSRPVEALNGFTHDTERGAERSPSSGISDLKDDFDPYSVNVEVGEQERRPSTRPEPFGAVRTWTRNAALHETNPDAWLYARVAFLFFCALLISWVPASINRLYSLIHPDSLIFGLNYTETLVLPLQGFWNSLVYIITSQTACRNLWRSLWGKSELPRKHSSGAQGGSSMATMMAGGGDAQDEWGAKAGGQDSALSQAGISMKHLSQKVKHVATATAATARHHGPSSNGSPRSNLEGGGGGGGPGVMSGPTGGVGGGGGSGGTSGNKGGKFDRFVTRRESVRLRDDGIDEGGEESSVVELTLSRKSEGDRSRHHFRR